MQERLNRVTSVITAALVVCAAPVAVGATIYDNSTSDLGPTSFTQLQIGDEVHPTGDERIVTQLFVGLTQQGFAGTADLQVRLYANDGKGGAPGTLLWESDLMDDVALTGQRELIAVDVPGVLVPDPFTWTVQISDTRPVAVGLPHFDPPTVGASPDYGWFGDGVTWTRLVLDDPVNFMARIVGVGDDCRADVDGSGVVDFADLLAVLSAWGACEGCPEDVTGDGVVNFADILAVLAAWGPCP